MAVVPVVHRRDPRSTPRAVRSAGGGDRGRYLWAHRVNSGDDRCDRFRSMQGDDVLQLAREIDVRFREPPGEARYHAMGMAEMVDSGDLCDEGTAIAADATDRHAAEIGAMIAALTADQAYARSVAARSVIGDRHLERGIRGFASGTGEEDAVESDGHQRGEAVGERDATAGRRRPRARRVL